MQKEFLIETRSVTDEKGNLLNLKYYLIEEESVQTRAPLYRICIKNHPQGAPVWKKRRARRPSPVRRLPPVKCSASLSGMRLLPYACWKLWMT